MLAVGAPVMSRQRVYLCNARHKRHQRRADASSRADEVSVSQRIGNQLLGAHINNVVSAGEDVAKLRFNALCDKLRRVFSVKLSHAAVDKVF